MTLLYPKKHSAGFLSLPLLFLGPILLLMLPLFIRRRTGRHDKWLGATAVTCWEMQSPMRVAGQDGRQSDCLWLRPPHGKHLARFATRPESTSTLLAPSANIINHPFLSRPPHIPPARDGLGGTFSYRPHPLLYPVFTPALAARAFTAHCAAAQQTPSLARCKAPKPDISRS
jgi:hypothetical protein